jgi:hypothetical protein
MPAGHLQARHFDLRSAAGESACLPPTVMTGLSCRGRSNPALCHAEGERRAGHAQAGRCTSWSRERPLGLLQSRPDERVVGLFYHLGLSTRLARGGTGRDEGSAISTKHLCQGIWKRTGFARLQVNGDNDHFGISHQLFICIDDHLF